MHTLEGLGLFGALTVILIALFAQRARRDARRKAQREELTCLCVSHLQTLGAALHAYQQDHNGELPRKFICRPDSILLTAGWGPNWNEASLADYVTDLDTYTCPCSGRVYGYRIPWLLRDGPRQLMRPEPDSVVILCDNHANWHGPKQEWSGEFLVLRLNGVVERIPASDAEIWRYWKGQWYSPAEKALDGANIWLVFPGEPWPPRFETVPVAPWPPVGRPV